MALTAQPTDADIAALATQLSLSTDVAKLVAWRNWKRTNIQAIRAEASTSPLLALQDFMDLMLVLT